MENIFNDKPETKTVVLNKGQVEVVSRALKNLKSLLQRDQAHRERMGYTTLDHNKKIIEIQLLLNQLI